MAKKSNVIKLEGIEKEIEVRGFKGKDIGVAAKVLKKLDVKGVFSEVKSYAKQFAGQEDDGAGAESVGYELIFGVIGNLGDAQDDVFTLIGNLCGCTKEEVEEFEIIDFYNVFLAIKEHKGTKSFLSLVLKSTK